ncbi:MAG: hypothetical protein BAA01_03610 [Bacillus thermozeamaize]|jgi:4a-hydroxytetrahydrobiopterin dehydratase|uniref:4a-hydroxytetrahydrobiopterin dehydratase n=1 Tax=Bacillus thermozeamaize TaxID=230954 RepID=A0A1Y3PVV1_9BACI|nr:MAG: hypothetical protein BAA01_03610 [Bacillus thermozeamaize]
MAKLNQHQIAVYMRYLSQWEEKDQRLEKTFLFERDEEAIQFVSLFCAKAKELKHLPEIHLTSRQVQLRLYTVDHEGHGITGKDFALAMAADQIFRQFVRSQVV